MSEKIKKAHDLLIEAAKDQSCAWCRSHILMVANDVEILYNLALLSENLRTHPTVLKILREMGPKLEQYKFIKIINMLLVFLKI